MEHLLRLANHYYSLGSSLRYVHFLLVLQGISGLVGRRSECNVAVLVVLDLFIQQDGQTLGTLLPLPGRHLSYSRLHRIRILSWPHQALGSLHVERGKLTHA